MVDANELSVASSERMNVSVIATGNVSVVSDSGVSGSKGGTTGVSTFTGEQTITAPVDASGDNITIVANSVQIDSTVRSAGAILTIVPIDPTRPIVLGDMPFGTYASPEQAFASAATLMQAGAHMVKLEGGAWLAPTIEYLVTRGIPVCGHIGLTPQSINTLGGYRVQGRTDTGAQQLKQDAIQLQNAGAQALVMEMVPAALSADITRSLPHCATIGIGAGVDTAGQILVLHDMLGVTQGKVPKFAHNFMADAGHVLGAMEAFVRAVKEKRFPVNELHAW